MKESEFVDMMHRLFELALAECPKCAMGLEPEKVDGFWRHGDIPDLNIRGHISLLGRSNARPDGESRIRVCV